MNPNSRKSFVLGCAQAVAAASLFLTIAGCQKKVTAEQAPPTPDVSMVEVRPQPVTPHQIFTGRVEAFRIAEIRPQVGGLIVGRSFTQGAMVQAGQPLFQIDPSVYRAEGESARAALDRAQAVYDRAHIQSERLRPLLQDDAISRQIYDDAHSAETQAAADLAQSRAMFERRLVDIGYATVTAPISGRVDQATATEGALASPGQQTPLAVVQQIDDVYVDLRAPLSQLTELQYAASPGNKRNIKIFDLDSTTAKERGTLLFSGIAVDQTTGSVLARVLVCNTKRRLLPGMFVRASVPGRQFRRAILVPQQAVVHDSSGNPKVFLINASGVAEERPVRTGDVIDKQYLVLSGLVPGDRVIVEGQDRVAVGKKVHGSPWTPAQ